MTNRKKDFDDRDDLGGFDDADDDDRRRSSRSDDDDTLEDGGDVADEREIPEPAPTKSLLSKLILPVGGGLFAGLAALGGFFAFFAEDDAAQQARPSPVIIQPSNPPAQTAQTAPGIPAPVPGQPGVQGGQGQVGLAPGFPQAQPMATPQPRSPLPPVAAGPQQPPPPVGQAPQTAMPAPTSPTPPQVMPMPSQPSMAEMPRVGPVQTIPQTMGTGTTFGQNQPQSQPQSLPQVVAGSMSEDVVSFLRRLEEDSKAMRLSLERIEGKVDENARLMTNAVDDMARQRRSMNAVVSGLMDMRMDMDDRMDTIARERSAATTDGQSSGAQAATRPPLPPAPANPAAQGQAATTPSRPVPTQIPTRYASLANLSRLIFTFPNEPIYDVDQKDNEIRVRFLGDELPSLLGLPAQIRNIESISTVPGMMEMLVSEGVSVRHTTLGNQLIVSFVNRGATPPESAGQAPRPRREERSDSQMDAQRRAHGQMVASPGQQPTGPSSSEPAAQSTARQNEISRFRLAGVSRRAVMLVDDSGEMHRVLLGEKIPDTNVIAQEVKRDGDVWVLVTNAGVLRP